MMLTSSTTLDRGGGAGECVLRVMEGTPVDLEVGGRVFVGGVGIE
jgi:hypothetical protein